MLYHDWPMLQLVVIHVSGNLKEKIMSDQCNQSNHTKILKTTSDPIIIQTLLCSFITFF